MVALVLHVVDRSFKNVPPSRPFQGPGRAREGRKGEGGRPLGRGRGQERQEEEGAEGEGGKEEAGGSGEEAGEAEAAGRGGGGH